MEDSFCLADLSELPVKIYTVSELTGLLKELIEGEFEAGVWVEGEVSNYTSAQSGHCYFVLKDSDAVLVAVMFRRAASTLKFKVLDGLKVVCFGRLSVYTPKGQHQIIVEHMEPLGLGALMLRFQQLKEKLEKEGLFAAARKRSLPMLPRRIGIVTSPTGAAIRDMVKIMQRRLPNVSILVCPVKVQGAEAAGEIAEAVRRLNEIGGLDVIIVGRGGGSVEDLWPFNEEIVARAIFSSDIPVVSAVGHERDYTIADFVADVRAKTPSEAAEIVAPDRADLQAKIQSLERWIIRGVRSKLHFLRERVNGFSKRLVNPRRRIDTARQRLDDLQPRLFSAATIALAARRQQAQGVTERLGASSPERAVLRARQSLERAVLTMGSLARGRLEKLRNRFKILAAKLQSLSPLAILSRGYSLTTTAVEGKVVRRAAEVSPGDRVNVQLQEGALLCMVEEKR